LEKPNIQSMHVLLAEIQSSAVSLKLASPDCIRAIALVKISSAHNACHSLLRMWKLFGNFNTTFLTSQLELYKNPQFSQVYLAIQRTHGQTTEDCFFSPGGGSLTKTIVFGMRQKYYLINTYLQLILIISIEQE